jgi:hypothetical protein
MRRILMIATTYYQLIMAVQMNDTIFKDDEITLLLLDRSQHAEQICERLRENKIFAEVHHIKEKRIMQRGPLEHYKDCFQAVFCKSNWYAYYLDGIKDLRFDAVMYYSHESSMYWLYCILYEYNKDIEVSLFEEGIMSYDVWLGEGLRKKLTALRHALGKKAVQDAFDKFYCLYPSVYNGTLKPVQVPKITRGSRCADILRVIFDVDGSTLAYPEKYIFFAGMSDLEGGEPVGEYQLACKIAELVGKDNLLVKTHPRDPRKIYEENGFHVDNSAVPWEVMELTRDFSDKILMTLTSTTVLSGYLLTDTAAERGYYLFLLCDTSKNPLTQKCEAVARNLLNNEKLNSAFKKVYVPLHIEDIL